MPRVFEPTLRCPLGREMSVCEIYPDELPEVSKIQELLIGEVPPLPVWLNFAVVLRRSGRTRDAADVLRLVNDHGDNIDQFLLPRGISREVILDGKARIAVALSALEVELSGRDAIEGHERGSAEHRERQRAHLRSAEEAIRRAERLADGGAHRVKSERLVELARGVFGLGSAQADEGKSALFMSKAGRLFREVLEGGESVPALVGHGIALFHEGHPAPALQCFLRALRLNPGSDASIYLGIAAAAERSGDLERAEMAARRALQLQAGNPDALFLHALLQLRRPRNALGTAEGVRGLRACARMISVANDVSLGRSPRLLNHTANAHFFRWVPLGDFSAAVGAGGDIVLTPSGGGEGAPAAPPLRRGDRLLLDGAREATVAAVERSGDAFRLRVAGGSGAAAEGAAPSIEFRDFGAAFEAAEKALRLGWNAGMRAESCFHMARVLHARGDFAAAKARYRSAIEQDPSFPLPYYPLAQLHLAASPPTEDSLARAVACLTRAREMTKQVRRGGRGGALPSSFPLRSRVLFGICVAVASIPSRSASPVASFFPIPLRRCVSCAPVLPFLALFLPSPARASPSSPPSCSPPRPQPLTLLRPPPSAPTSSAARGGSPPPGGCRARPAARAGPRDGALPPRAGGAAAAAARGRVAAARVGALRRRELRQGAPRLRAAPRLPPPGRPRAAGRLQQHGRPAPPPRRRRRRARSRRGLSRIHI